MHTGKREICYPHIQTTDVFIDFFLNYRSNRNRAQRLFFAALHQRCTALHKSCLSTVWPRVAIFLHLYGSAPAALSVATAAVKKMDCCSKQKTAFVQPFCSTHCSAVLTSSVSYGQSTFCNNILYITLGISGRCWTLRSLYVTMVKD